MNVVIVFVQHVAGKLRPGVRTFFPPEVKDLQVWSTLFRSEGTWANYVSYVRTACMIVQVSTQVTVFRAYVGECCRLVDCEGV